MVKGARIFREQELFALDNSGGQYLCMDQTSIRTKSGAVFPYFEFDLVSAPETTRRLINYGALAIGLWFWKVSLHKETTWMLRLIGSLWLIAGMTGFWKTKVVADGSTRTVRVQSRFLGRYVTWQRKFSFSDFGSVVLDVDLEAKIAQVHLRKVSGRNLKVRYGSSQGDAQWVARRLSEVTKLPLKLEEF
jgi:hypothetical protein